MVQGKNVLGDAPDVPLYDTASPPHLAKELFMGIFPSAHTVLPSLRRLLCLSGLLLLSSGLLLGVLLTSAQAQVTTTITSDGTLGTAVTQRGTVHDIIGGTRPGNGPNLFHSFDRFSVGKGDTANFTSEQTGIK